ncbi:MAG: nitroreductase family protein [Lachnospiraceae bacterium]
MNEIFHRTSIRQYIDKEVETFKVVELLKAAMAAPSAGNQQPWEYYVVRNKKMLEELSKCSPYAGCAGQAPLAFVACTRKNCNMPEYAQIDISASIENLLLEADSLELGAVWLGIAPLADRMRRVKEILNIPETLEAFAIIPCGYPIKIDKQQDRFDESRIHYVD